MGRRKVRFRTGVRTNEGTTPGKPVSRKQRGRAARRAWEAKNGPVVVSYRDPKG